MDNFKSIYVKYEDEDKLLQCIKEIMTTYDMKLIGHTGTQYKFDRDRSYSRSFIIDPPVNGWIQIQDEDYVQAELLSQELSDMLGCFAVCMGIQKDLLHYAAFDKGTEIDQYLSTFDYYEYDIDDNVIEKYKGNPEVFSYVIEDTGALQNVLERCKNGEIAAVQAFGLILVLLGVSVKEEEAIEENQEEGLEEEMEGVINIEEIFYVDFESINIKTHNRQDVINAVKQIADEMGYREVNNFSDEDNKKVGFLKRLLSTLSESKRLLFYISPVSNGWVTLVGEVQTLLGKEPVEWNFLHIEDRLSNIIKTDILNVFADNEKWGLSVYRDGAETFQFDSQVNNGNLYDMPMELENRESLMAISSAPNDSPQGIDKNFSQFCSILNIKNCKINIPMDYSQEEYTHNILGRLPEGNGFTSLKFI